MYNTWLAPEKTRIRLADGTDFDLADAVAIRLAEPWVEVIYGAQFAPSKTVYLSPTEWRRVETFA